MSANFEPDRHVVTAITNANPAIVTAIDHKYRSSDIVRINVPLNYGMRLPRKALEIIVLTSDTFSINYDTTLLDAFINRGGTITSAEVIPISQETENIA